MESTASKWVTIWLIIGLVMVYLQIVIGGITRLTGSGLSITEWDIVTGTIPPMTEASWHEEFAKYRTTPQYEKINEGMELGSIFQSGTFKFIFFWEYLHRLWARTMGFVFLFPFLFFYYKKWIPKSLMKGLVSVILLAVIAATFGWIMVASGLINRPWVNAYKLSLHLCIGIGVFIALWWTFIRYKYSYRYIRSLSVPKYVVWMLGLLVFQIFLGGVMSGTKAALFINTWPDLNGAIVPGILMSAQDWSVQNFNEYESSGFLVSLVQFLHRSTAYIILGYTAYIAFSNKYWRASSIQGRSYLYFTALVAAQVVVGIITLVLSVGQIPVYCGVLHQALAVLVLSSYVLHMFFVRYDSSSHT